jgi:hypothetical protein
MNEQFEKWYSQLNDVECYGEECHKAIAYHAWQAATQASEAKCQKMIDTTVEGIELNHQKLLESQAQNEKLREGLEFECGNRCNAENNPCNAREVLLATQSPNDELEAYVMRRLEFYGYAWFDKNMENRLSKIYPPITGESVIGKEIKLYTLKAKGE